MRTILNFARVHSALATAGQPTHAQLAAAVQAGVSHVVRLSTLESGLEDEAGIARDLGLNYLHIPVVWTDPRPEDLRYFVAAMAERRQAHVLVHCAKNFRVSVFVALSMLHTGQWDADQAVEWVLGVWQPNEVWTAFCAEHGLPLGLGRP